MRGVARHLAIAGTAALGALACAGAADAAVLGVQDDRLTSGPIPEVPSRARLLDISQAKVTRIDVLWSLVAPERPADPRDPADPAYRWERTDAVLSAIAALDITPIVVSYSAPAWATGGRGAPPGSEVNPNAPPPAAYAAFMTALARRYTGRYRPAGATQPLPRVRHFEIWNEPNLAAFLSPQVSGGRRVAISRYVAMLRAAGAAVKRVNPAAVVIAGAGGPRSSTDSRGTGALPWARAIASSNASFGALSQHVYPAAAPRASTRAFPAWGTLPQLIDALDAVPRRRGTPVYITEAGYTTAATPFRTVRVTESQQARYLRQIMALPVVRSPRVPVVIWFNLQDNPNWPGGLRRENGSTKPSHAAFTRIARASRRGVELLVRPPVALSRRQLLINQRISQAAVRRVNLIEERLDAGLGRDDLRPGGVAEGAFAPGIGRVQAPGSPAFAPPPLARAPETPPAPTRRPGAAATVRLTVSQLVVNQRISQAAVRRANGLAARLQAGLTGGDLRAAAIDASRLAAGLTITTAPPTIASAPASATTVAPGSSGPARGVGLSAGQLLVNQRVSQAAVRRAGALAATLAAGVTSDDLKAGTVGSDRLDPSLVP